MTYAPLQLEGTKLLWHMDRVEEWLCGKRIAPLHIDVGLSKGCNIRCEYCFGAMQGNLYKRRFDITFPREPLLRYVREAGEIGVRSMAFIGEAEPLLNPYVYEAIKEGKKAGVDISLGTNGILYDTGKAGEEALEYLTWIRFNISAASYESYLKIHRSKDFYTAIKKIEFCVKTKVKKRLDVTIGLQMVLTPNNYKEVIPLAKLGRELGVDYLVVKQCSDAQDNTLGFYKRLEEYDNFFDVLKEAEKYSEDNYKVIIKWNMIKNKGKRNYDRCLGAPFLLYSSGDGKIYPCGMFFDRYEEEFRLGDLLNQSLKEIIESKRYEEVMLKVSKLNVHTFCYSNCRTHFVNEFLWKLLHPPAHINFI